MRFAACNARNILEGLMKMAGLAHVGVIREVDVLSKLLTAKASACTFVRFKACRNGRTSSPD
jgi:hypothetical protein